MGYVCFGPVHVFYVRNPAGSRIDDKIQISVANIGMRQYLNFVPEAGQQLAL